MTVRLPPPLPRDLGELSRADLETLVIALHDGLSESIRLHNENIVQIRADLDAAKRRIGR